MVLPPNANPTDVKSKIPVGLARKCASLAACSLICAKNIDGTILCNIKEKMYEGLSKVVFLLQCSKACKYILKF